MRLGVLVVLNDEIEQKLAEVHEMGFRHCQINCWNMDLYNEEMAQRIEAACAKYDVRISTLWCGWSGPSIWNFTEGPDTLGLVPVQYRAMRLEQLKMGSDFAKRLGVANIATHVGFLPENPSSKEYQEILPCLRELCEYCKANGQEFLFETGQETPVTLKRTIEDIGTGNAGVNLDAANLILYGKANSVDALGILGPYIRNLHANDGKYATTGRELGRETKLGEGDVNFPAFIAKLKSQGYDGDITIEREISGEQQRLDILEAKEFLEKLLQEA